MTHFFFIKEIRLLNHQYKSIKKKNNLHFVIHECFNCTLGFVILIFFGKENLGEGYKG